MWGLQNGVMLVGSLLERGIFGNVRVKLYGAMGSKFMCAANNERKGRGQGCFLEHTIYTRTFLWFLAFFS